MSAPKLLTWPDLTNRAKPTPDTTVSYGPAPEQKVDVWLPAVPRNPRRPHPVVLMVHGGCWQTSIADRSLMNWIAADLRREGIAVWNIDYRGVDRPGGGYPGTFQDVAAAADSLVRNAGRYNLDLTRVVAVGHSAGGHLALWLAGRSRLPADSALRRIEPNTPLDSDVSLHENPRALGLLRIHHVISLGGLPDLEATAASQDNGCGTEVVGKLTGGRYADTSVPRLLPLGVRQDLVNGREDRIIPYRFATGYRDQARNAGDRVALHPVPHTGHVELIAPETAAWAETKRLIRAALRLPPLVTPALSRGPASSHAGQGSGTPAQGRGDGERR